jgi:hypothetical protein
MRLTLRWILLLAGSFLVLSLMLIAPQREEATGAYWTLHETEGASPGTRALLLTTPTGGTWQFTPDFPAREWRDFQFSPDGKWIFFYQRNAAGRFDLMRIRPGHKAPQRIANSVDPPFLVWDGPGGQRRLLLASMRGGEEALFWSGPGGDGLTRLTDFFAVIPLFYWSADGEWVYFDEYSPVFRRNRSYRVNLFSGRQEVLTDGMMNAEWSPDGEWIAFNVVGARGKIYRMRPDGTRREQVSPRLGNYWVHEWLPNEWLVVQQRAGSGRTVVFRMRPDGESLTPLMDAGHDLYDYLGSTSNGRWAFISAANGDPANTQTVFRVEVKTLDARELMTVAEWSPVAWSGDGALLVGAGDGPAGHGLYVLAGDGSDRRFLAEVPAKLREMRLHLTDDERWAVVSYETTRPDVREQQFRVSLLDGRREDLPDGVLFDVSGMVGRKWGMGDVLGLGALGFLLGVVLGVIRPSHGAR